MEYHGDHIKLQGEIINYSIKIERIINSILLQYFSPKNDIIFATYMLNSSVINFGGKLKVLRAIGLDNKHCSNLQKLGSIRNSFAHTNSNFNYAAFFTKEVSESEMSVMNSNGVIKYKEPSTLHADFIKLYIELNDALDAFKSSLKQ